MKLSVAIVLAVTACANARAVCLVDEDDIPQRVLGDISVAASSTFPAASPTATLPYELHVGKLNDKKDPAFYTFANIPYAKPPTGSRRFAKPEALDWIKDDKQKPVNEGNDYRICHGLNASWFDDAVPFIADWTLNRDLGDYVKPPSDSSTSPPDPISNASEDCLLLDVVVPKKLIDQGLDECPFVPVVVWFHGGGYIFGHKNLFNSPWGLFNATTSNSTYGEDEVIYVTANYRLGAYGFLTAPDFQEKGGIPNAGFHDQALVLNWVKENIWAFCGSPYDVTVMGESAGASSILHHMTAYGGPSRRALFRPPFKRAILQSPAFFPESSDKQEAAIYKEFLNQVGVTDLEGLRNAPAEKLEEANRNMIWKSPYGLFAFGPAVDGDYLPYPLSLALLYGKYWKDVEVFVAHNGNEGLLFTPPWIQDDDGFKGHLKKAFPDMRQEDIDTALSLYPLPDEKDQIRKNIQRTANAMADVAVVCNVGYILDSFPKMWTSKYVFDVNPGFHGQDCLYTYDDGTNNLKNPTAPTPATRPIAVWMQNWIANFARYGDPNGNPYQEPEYKDTPEWLPRLPNYEKSQVGKVSAALAGVIPTKSVYESTADTWYNKTRCDFWKFAPYWQPDESYKREL